MEAVFCILLDIIVSFWVTDKMASANCRYCHLSQSQQPELLPLIPRLEQTTTIRWLHVQVWSSWIYRIIVFIKSEIFWPLFFQKIFYSSCPLPITHKLDHLILFHRSLQYCVCIFCLLCFTFSIDSIMFQAHWSFLLQCLISCQCYLFCFPFQILIFSIIISWR